MKHLGVDFGLKRVGLAVSDPAGRVALPYKTIVRTTRDALFAEIARIIEDERVEAIVVGLPLRSDGEDSLTTRQARNFAESLTRRLGLPVSLWDETLTSFDAKEDLRAQGLSRDRIAEVLDQLAATRMLESYLAEHGEGMPPAAGGQGPPDPLTV